MLISKSSKDFLFAEAVFYSTLLPRCRAARVSEDFERPKVHTNLNRSNLTIQIVPKWEFRYRRNLIQKILSWNRFCTTWVWANIIQKVLLATNLCFFTF